MADGENKITIGIEAEVGQLVAGLKKAEAELKQAGKRLEAIAAQNGAKAGKAMGESYAKEAAAAQRRIAASRSAVFGGNDGVAASGASATDTLARRANVLLGIQAAVAAVRSVEAASAAIRGEWDQVQDILDRLPMGVGAFNQGLRMVSLELSGINEEMREAAAIAGRMASENAALSANEAAKGTLSSIQAENAARGAASPAERERILTDEAKRVAREQQRALVSAGVDPSVAARIYAESLKRETDRIIERVSAEYERAQLERGRKDQAIEEADRAMRAKIEADRMEAERRARVDAINADVAARRKADESMSAELSKAQSVTGDNFVRSIGTAFGEFKFAQNGAAQAVARAQIRATELLGDINENTKQLVILNKERDGILSLR